MMAMGQGTYAARASVGSDIFYTQEAQCRSQRDRSWVIGTIGPVSTDETAA